MSLHGNAASFLAACFVYKQGRRMSLHSISLGTKRLRPNFYSLPCLAEGSSDARFQQLGEMDKWLRIKVFDEVMHLVRCSRSWISYSASRVRIQLRSHLFSTSDELSDFSIIFHCQ